MLKINRSILKIVRLYLSKIDLNQVARTEAVQSKGKDFYRKDVEAKHINHVISYITACCCCCC